MKELRINKRGQSGFTLIELIIAMSVITLLLLASGVFSFSGAQSKSTNIMSIMKELGNGALRYNAHTGVMPVAPWSLFNKDKNLAVDTFQGVIATDSWKGPYSNGFGATATGDYKLDAFVAGASIGFDQISTGLPPGTTTGYRAVVTSVPEEIVRQIVADCNGTSVGAPLPTDHIGGDKCIGAVSGGIGSVSYLFSSM